MKKNINKLFLIIALSYPSTTFAAPNDCIETAFNVCIPRNQAALKTLIAHFFAWAAGIIGTLAMLGLIYAGYVYITSAGNPDRIGYAKEIITTSITALLIIIFSYALFQLLGIKY